MCNKIYIELFFPYISHIISIMLEMRINRWKIFVPLPRLINFHQKIYPNDCKTGFLFDTFCISYR